MNVDLAGKYHVQEMIGKGGIGEIYKSFDTKKKRVVAIKKLMSVDKVRKRRFKREYRLLQKIDHPFFVRSFDFFEHNEHAYLVMEYIEGKTLREIILNHKKSFSLPEQLAIANKIARAVEILNMAGIIHRDIKPDNIIIDDETSDIKILDLGLAKDTSYSSVQITKGDDFLGTPLYASPEQVTGENTSQSDIFSLCTVLYQFFLWEDRSPFYDENEFAILYKITDYHPPALIEKILMQGRDLSPQESEAYKMLSELLKQGMDKNQSKRPETAKIADCLAQIQQNLLHAQKYSQVGIKRLELSNPIDTLLSKKLATIRISYQDIHGVPVRNKEAQKNELHSKRNFEYFNLVEWLQEHKFAFLIGLNITVLALLIVAVIWIFGGENNVQKKPESIDGAWVVAKEFANEANLSMGKVLGASKQENYELLNKSKELYCTAINKAETFFEQQAVEFQKQNNLSIEKARTYTRTKFKDRFLIVKDWKRSIQDIEVLISKEEHFPINEKIWKACWNTKLKIFDFTQKEWQNLPPNLQMQYTKKYQFWHAQRNKKDIEKTFKVANIDIVMMYIPPGKFWQGSPSTEVDRDKHEGRKEVMIKDSFWLGKYEVTQQQWYNIVQKKPWLKQELMSDNDVHAANFISWDDIKQLFLSNLGEEYDFPTESQWEYACRAGSSSKFYWGENITYIGKYANVMDKTTSTKYPLPGIDIVDGYAEIAPVGSLEKNAFGLHDMIGNVMEWCKDDYVDFSPNNALPVNEKIQRGGAWNSFWTGSLRSAYRIKYPPNYKSNSCGFRIYRKMDTENER